LRELDFLPDELDKPDKTSKEDEDIFKTHPDDISLDQVRQGELGIEWDHHNEDAGEEREDILVQPT
jgi:hypothetical protein